LTDLLGVVQLAHLHEGAAQPEQRQVSNDAVRICLQEILQHSRSLIIATLVVQVLAFSKHGLLGVARDIAILSYGAGRRCGFNDRCKGSEQQRRRKRRSA